jgi:hypothetical protein
VQRHEQPVVVGVLVTDGCDDGQGHGVLVQRPTGGGSADPSAAAHRRMCGYRLRPVRRATREQFTDPGGGLVDEHDVLLGPAHPVMLAAALSGDLVAKACPSSRVRNPVSRSPHSTHAHDRRGMKTTRSGGLTVGIRRLYAPSLAGSAGPQLCAKWL